MFPYFLLGLALLIGLFLLSRWFVTADPRVLARVLKVTAVCLAIGLVIYLTAAGRWSFALLLAAILIPTIMRRRLLRRMAHTARGPTPGQRSEVETKYLRMALDHDTGVMAGTVLEGTYQGRLLLEMKLEELLDLLAECAREDPDSVGVLEAFIDRTQGTNWRETASAGASGADGAGGMTRAEAYRILGLEPGADDSAVREAHRRLMQQMHPDHGGSDYLAAKINQAKELLLND